MCVDECVGDASVAEELHDVEYVFGLVIFHRGFPVAKSVCARYEKFDSDGRQECHKVQLDAATEHHDE
jgi:hypothetical protein